MKRATANGEMRSTKGDNKSGRGDGNGHDRPRRPEELTGQPSIIDLLGPQMTPELSKKILLTALIALKKGDFTARLPVDLPGMDGKIADAFNEVVELNQRMAEELERLSRVVGKEGKISQRAAMGDVTGSWKESVESVNTLIGDLVHPVSETSRVIGAVAKGDLSQTMAMEIEGRAAGRRIPAHRQNRQHDGGAARQLRLRSDARGPRSGHRRKARRPGQGEGRRRNMEGPDRLRELDGRATSPPRCATSPR